MEIYRNSAVRIYKNVKMDKDYFNVLDPLTDQQILTAIASNLVAYNSQFSFIRDTGKIQASFNYSDALKCNYVAFQNPDYDNKYFFGWIDSIEYVNENTVTINYTLDYWTTWSSRFNFNPVLVEREHVNVDTVGEHILPEPVTAGTAQAQNTVLKRFSNYDIVVNSANDTAADADPITAVGNYINTAYSYCFTSAQLAEAKNWIAHENPTGRLINCILYPTEFTGKNNAGLAASVATERITIPTPTALNGYTPVNNKLFTYPYSYLLIDNCSNQALLRYENFSNFNSISCIIKGFANPIGEITCLPENYELINENPYHSITIRDFPQLPMALDTYMAWVAQKSNSAAMQSLSSVGTGAIMGAMTGGIYGAAIGALGGMIAGTASYALQEGQAADAADSIKGGNSSGIIDAATGNKGFYFKQMALKYDNAVSIDNFFSMFGYNVSCVKTPNITGRTYWNYVKINGNGGYGEMPEAARNKINTILNNGVTIWHSHSYMGNYRYGGNKMQNPIITP